MSGLCTPWMELRHRALSLQTLLTTKRNIPAGWAWTMLVCPQAGERGDTKRILQVTLFLNWTDLFPLLSSSFWEQGRGQRQRQWEPSCLRDENGSLPCLPFPCLGNRLRAGPFFPFFWEYFVQRLGRHEECLFHACLSYACSPARSWGPLFLSQVSFVGTG